MTDLDKAREWASGIEHLAKVIHPDAQAAIEIIQSLPDHWVDAEKVREIADDLESMAQDSVLKNRFVEQARRLRNLTTPKLPTLADMSEEERAACRWKQCRVKGFSEDERLVIAYVDERWITLWREDGTSIRTNPGAVTPLPGEPKLKWPSGVVDVEIVEEPEPTDSDPIHTPMQPSEVPPNEPWLIEANGQKAIGTRHKGSTIVPWSVAALDGSFAGDFHDNEVTLIHKLVPEPPALPEGMRLADHEEYGRVVVSPKVDTDGDYKVFHLNGRFGGGAVFHFVRPDDLTFLDGDQHV